MNDYEEDRFLVYIDPTFNRVAYEDLSLTSTLHKWKITAESGRNVHHSDSMLLDLLKQIVMKTDFAIPVNKGYDGELRVIFRYHNQGYDPNDILYKAKYGMVIQLKEKNVITKQKAYKHSLIFTLENHIPAPKGEGPYRGEMREVEGEARIIEEMFLRGLKEITQGS
jgi:hypothetical protein